MPIPRRLLTALRRQATLPSYVLRQGSKADFRTPLVNVWLVLESVSKYKAVGQSSRVVAGGQPLPPGPSDELFNLGSALSFAQALPQGVYVAMNGRCFAWYDVVNDRELGAFEPRR